MAAASSSPSTAATAPRGHKRRAAAVAALASADDDSKTSASVPAAPPVKHAHLDTAQLRSGITAAQVWYVYEHVTTQIDTLTAPAAVPSAEAPDVNPTCVRFKGFDGQLPAAAITAFTTRAAPLLPHARHDNEVWATLLRVAYNAEHQPDAAQCRAAAQSLFRVDHASASDVKNCHDDNYICELCSEHVGERMATQFGDGVPSVRLNARRFKAPGKRALHRQLSIEDTAAADHALDVAVDLCHPQCLYQVLSNCWVAQDRRVATWSRCLRKAFARWSDAPAGPTNDFACDFLCLLALAMMIPTANASHFTAVVADVSAELKSAHKAAELLTHPFIYLFLERHGRYQPNAEKRCEWVVRELLHPHREVIPFLLPAWEPQFDEDMPPQLKNCADVLLLHLWFIQCDLVQSLSLARFVPSNSILYQLFMLCGVSLYGIDMLFLLGCLRAVGQPFDEVTTRADGLRRYSRAYHYRSRGCRFYFTSPDCRYDVVQGMHDILFLKCGILTHLTSAPVTVPLEALLLSNEWRLVQDNPAWVKACVPRATVIGSHTAEQRALVMFTTRSFPTTRDLHAAVSVMRGALNQDSVPIDDIFTELSEIERPQDDSHWFASLGCLVVSTVTLTAVQATADEIGPCNERWTPFSMRAYLRCMELGARPVLETIVYNLRRISALISASLGQISGFACHSTLEHESLGVHMRVTEWLVDNAAEWARRVRSFAEAQVHTLSSPRTSPNPFASAVVADEDEDEDEDDPGSLADGGVHGETDEDSEEEDEVVDDESEDDGFELDSEADFLEDSVSSSSYSSSVGRARRDHSLISSCDDLVERIISSVADARVVVQSEHKRRVHHPGYRSGYEWAGRYIDFGCRWLRNFTMHSEEAVALLQRIGFPSAASRAEELQTLQEQQLIAADVPLATVTQAQHDKAISCYRMANKIDLNVLNVVMSYL